MLSYSSVVSYLEKKISIELYQQIFLCNILSDKVIKQKQVFLREVIYNIFLSVIFVLLYLQNIVVTCNYLILFTYV